jgi:dihydroneopterin aldolase
VGDDVIAIKGLKASGHVGVEASERDKPQPLEVDLELKLDASDAGRSDRLDDTVDYKTLVDEVVELVSSTSCSLLEALAQRIADAVLNRSRVDAVTVSVTKLALTLGPDLDKIQVRITRRR